MPYETLGRAKEILQSFCDKVEELGPEYSGICAIDSKNWDRSMSQDVATQDLHAVEDLFANMLNTLRLEHGWGPFEVTFFLKQLAGRLLQEIELDGQLSGLPLS